VKCPAISEEVEAAEEEGVIFHFLMAPLEVIGENGKVTRYQVAKDEAGRI